MAEVLPVSRYFLETSISFLSGGVRLNPYSFCHEECLDMVVVHLAVVRVYHV